MLRIIKVISIIMINVISPEVTMTMMKYMNMKLGPALKIFNIVNMLHGKKHQPLPNWNWERAPHRHFKMDLAVIGRWRNSSLLQNMQDLQNKIILLFLWFVADLPLIYHRRVHPFLDALKSVLKGGGTKNTYIIGSKKKSRYIMDPYFWFFK